MTDEATRQGSLRREHVVRSAGRWVSTPLPVSGAVDLDLERLLHLIDSCEPTIEPSTPLWTGTVAPVGASDLIGPAWQFVGLVVPDGMWVHSADSRRCRLDRTDVGLLDALVGTTTASDLVPDPMVGAVGLDDRRVRLGRLIALGCAVLVECVAEPVAEQRDDLDPDDEQAPPIEGASLRPWWRRKG